jgi:hypothetical protein
VVYSIDSGNGFEDYRFSAKNWSYGRGDLGFTSIDAGISRSSTLLGGLSTVE